MNMKLVMAAASVMLVAAAPAFAGTDFTKALTEGKVSGDLRARYENVDTNGLQDANASTLRTRLGYTTGDFYGISGTLEAENVWSPISEDYNDTVNGKTTKSVVADPETTEINQAFLQYGMYDTTAKVGRQVIEWQDGRFIGDSGWRQNQTTFDALSLSSSFIKHVDANYAYIVNQHTNVGEESATGAVESDSHMINVTTDIVPHVTLGAYAYFIDLENALATLDSNTYGVMADGSYAIDQAWKLLYNGAYAWQSEANDNPANYDLNYYNIAAGAGYKSFWAKVGYEVFEGNGTNSFTVPYGDGHLFNGRADVINPQGTIAQGLEDLSVSAGVEIAGVHKFVDGIMLGAEYHDFTAENNSADYGTEWNASAGLNFGKYYNAEVVYADYDADTFGADTQKIILQVGAKF